MPKRADLSTIAILGAGPIVIGQACEFDYSGVQACKALREEGYRIILINSNPATIMTDPEQADATYIEPITPRIVAKILEKERPDALLSTMGGQTALNCAMDLWNDGSLQALGIEMIGARSQTIEKAENRLLFRQAMEKIGLKCPRSRLVDSLEQAERALEELGLPLVIRPSFTLSGSGGGIAFTVQDLRRIVENGLRHSPVGEVLVEESVIGWKEFELEVVRDKEDNCIIVCSIENVDPMGVHTGDSITVAPALTLTDKEYQGLRDAAVAIMREIGVDTGGANVQFAVDPRNGEVYVIEMNPRVSRSSALASKATGFPIARVAAKLAIGYRLDELRNDINRVTPASFEPALDYVVTKIPRFTFEKFLDAASVLTTSMKSIGEAMGIGRCFAESLQKALRSLDIGWEGLDVLDKAPVDEEELMAALSQPRPERLLLIAQAFRLSVSFERIQRACDYDPWFLEQIEGLIEVERQLVRDGLPTSQRRWRTVKGLGFSDKRIARLLGLEESEVTLARQESGVFPVFKRVDTCAAEFTSPTPYLYSTYESNGESQGWCEAEPSTRKKVVILGSGPNRIGQGVEFDYCCVHAAYALREAGYETIMINCNPETVSTDYDTSDRLYFEPLTLEDVREVIRVEQERGDLLGVIVQFGGQTPLKLALGLKRYRVPILGTTPESIERSEDREQFKGVIERIGLLQPLNGVAYNRVQALEVAARIGYPLILRPSYVLGGRAMEIVEDETGLRRYIDEAVKVSGDTPLLLDQFLRDAIEVDVDLIAQEGEKVYIAGVMEHVESAGVHSGDSACVFPPYTLRDEVVDEIERQATLLARTMMITGLGNIQMAVQGDRIFILEVNPRASRTVPFIAKSTGIFIAKIAAKVMTGEDLEGLLPQRGRRLPLIAVKEAVFPFRKFDGVDVLLGPEMRSSGEVMGLESTWARAYAKAQLGTGISLPMKGRSSVVGQGEGAGRLT